MFYLATSGLVLNKRIQFPFKNGYIKYFYIEKYTKIQFNFLIYFKRKINTYFYTHCYKLVVLLQSKERALTSSQSQGRDSLLD